MRFAHLSVFASSSSSQNPRRAIIMSYPPTPGSIYPSSTPPKPNPSYYAVTPPAPPPKPSGSTTPARGPPLPPPPPTTTSTSATEPSELAGSQGIAFQHQQPPPSGASSLPPLEPTWLPDILKDKSTRDLHDLLHDPTLQTALLDNPSTAPPTLTASYALLTPQIHTNINLASALLALETRVRTQRESTQSRLLALRALEQQHRAKLAETERVVAGWSPMALYQRLAAGVQEQQMLVRGVEESWLEEDGIAGEREVGEFVKRVKEGRRTAFLRKERKERWDEGRVGGWR
ncbi:hypothetical protein M433DRAFT_361506 [Acidomyces richmondensis BFW]|nr:MAG: hypothetical protein FE78DRAFT_194887 [Acidomyces sp. 'richmondensis']KYG49046.1 hypothetical protein M433DRAFT_361506 [Acidomyces richmondensis BFW]